MNPTMTPALTQLAKQLDHFDVQADPRKVALVFLELAKVETEDRGRLTDWLQQLARDMACTDTAR